MLKTLTGPSMVACHWNTEVRNKAVTRQLDYVKPKYLPIYNI